MSGDAAGAGFAGVASRGGASDVSAIVLAAGQSTRMGRNKLLLSLGGTTVVRRAVGTAIEAGLSPVFVILGHESGRIREELGDLSCTPIVNEDYAAGMTTSVRKGFQAVSDEAAAGIVLLGDMPFVMAEMIEELVRTFRSSKASLVVSTYEGVVAPPILYGRSLFPELRSMEGEGCGKKVVKRHRGEAVEVAWPASALSDLDVPADFELARERVVGMARERRITKGAASGEES
jgi:molybdenum cofactor cytidylyltransferase